MWVIYKHTNKSNNKSYIGQTKQELNERWRNGQGYYNSAPLFYKAIQKYGWNNFTHEVIEKNISTQEEANQKEQYWIKYYDCCVLDGKDKGYNIDRGGKGFSSEQASKTSKQNWTKPEYRKIFEKPVICLNNNQIYPSIKAASNVTSIHKNSISKACLGIHKSAGKDKNNIPLQWAYYEEGKEYKYNPNIDKKNKKIICLTTGEIFNTITEANKKYNISTIGECVNGHYLSAGQLKDGTRLCWALYEEGKQYKKQTNLGKSHKPVICLNNKKIFNTIKEGADYVHRAPSNLSAHLHGRLKSCGTDENGIKMIWKFLEDYEREGLENDI